MVEEMTKDEVREIFDTIANDEELKTEDYHILACGFDEETNDVAVIALGNEITLVENWCDLIITMCKEDPELKDLILFEAIPQLIDELNLRDTLKKYMGKEKLN